jgi:hypothetical protein
VVYQQNLTKVVHHERRGPSRGVDTLINTDRAMDATGSASPVRNPCFRIDASINTASH